ncbi:MAG: HAMP domain-containing protein [Rhodobacteraceae bacterium]|nr:HAMP domain-containing protein [Paracoccaceae bacterium]
MTAWLSRSIIKKLLVAFLAIFLATYVATALVVFTSVRTSIADAQANALDTIANQRIGNIFTAIDSLATNLRAWAKLDVMNDIPAGDIDKRIASSLDALKLDYRLDGEIYVFDSDDILIASSSVLPDVPQTVRPPQWQTRDRGVTFVDKSRNPFEASPGVALTLPIYASFDAGFRLGTLVATIPWSAVSGRLVGEGFHAILFDRSMRRVTDSHGIDSALAGEVDELASETRRLSIDGTPHVAGYSTLTSELVRGWQVIVLRDLGDVDASVNQVALQLVGLGLALAVPIVVFVVWLSRRITSPVRELKAAVGEITSSGDLSGRVAVSSSDELGTLATAFNEMAGSLQVVSADREKALRELEALNLNLEKRVKDRTHDLASANQKLATLSEQLSRYLSPQIYESIFEGRQAVEISTKRKQLTVFFSDVKDFTATTEDLQPEELNFILNDYLTRMTATALKYGATIDKYVGDAMLVFFGDPSTRGVQEDAIACVKMAVAMQREMVDLRAKWVDMGYPRPLHMRIGINTGFCNVGNFGSDLRMDYTIIGAEVNLAARLESICEPDGVVISGHTYQLVKNEIDAVPQDPIQVKGISKPVTPYRVHGIFDDMDRGRDVIRSDSDEMRLFVDLRNLSEDRRRQLAAELEAKANLLRQQK